MVRLIRSTGGSRLANIVDDPGIIEVADRIALYDVVIGQVFTLDAYLDNEGGFLIGWERKARRAILVAIILLAWQHEPSEDGGLNRLRLNVLRW